MKLGISLRSRYETIRIHQAFGVKGILSRDLELLPVMSGDRIEELRLLENYLTMFFKVVLSL